MLAEFPLGVSGPNRNRAGRMMLDYTAIDFETANSYRGSPCSVGLVRVRDGIPVEECHWLIRPPEQVDHFDHFNIALHGITPEMVATAPPMERRTTGHRRFHRGRRRSRAQRRIRYRRHPLRLRRRQHRMAGDPVPVHDGACASCTVATDLPAAVRPRSARRGHRRPPRRARRRSRRRRCRSRTRNRPRRIGPRRARRHGRCQHRPNSQRHIQRQRRGLPQHRRFFPLSFSPTSTRTPIPTAISTAEWWCSPER